LNIFSKLSKTISMSKELKKTYNKSILKNGDLIIKNIEAECEKDKSMSNLKGKVKEI
jgi:hypothetical protein